MVGMVLEDVPKGAFLEVLVPKGGFHRAIP